MKTEKYAICMIIFKNQLYLVGACLSAWVHRKFISQYNLKIELIAIVDSYIYNYKNELDKYFDNVICIDMIKIKLNPQYRVIDKYSDWMSLSPSKWNILNLDQWDKILFVDTDILPIDEKFYHIFNFNTPAIMIKGNNSIENTIADSKLFLPNASEILLEEYPKISTQLKNSLDAGIILIKPNKKLFNEYLNFLSICEGTNGYISKYDSGVDETTLLLFFVFYKKIPVHIIPYSYVPIPWEKNPYNLNNVRGINFLSMIKPWVKLPIIQFADENIWHIIAKKALDKNSKITKIYIKYLIDELYNFYYNWKKLISKQNSPYNMELLKSKNIRDKTFELFDYLAKYKKYDLDINQIKHIMNLSKEINKFMNKKILVKFDNLYKIIGYTDELKNKYQLSRNIINKNDKINKTTNITDTICDIKFEKNLTRNKNVFVDVFDFNDKKFIIKKEIYENKTELNEYLFHKKFDSKIKKTFFKNFILIPEKIIDCPPNSVVYKYSKLNYDYDKTIIDRLAFDKWIDYTIEICLTLFYLNHKLKIYHNDLIYKNNYRNIMIDYNQNKTDIEIDLFKYSTNSNHIVIIDFGHSHYKPKLRTFKFYNNKYKKNVMEYKYISEIFIIYYYFYKFHNRIDDYWDEKYDELYIEFETKSTSFENFDSNIIEKLFDIKKSL